MSRWMCSKNIAFTALEISEECEDDMLGSLMELSGWQRLVKLAIYQSPNYIRILERFLTNPRTYKI